MRGHRRVIVALLLLLALAGAGVSGAAFVATSSNATNQLGAAADWVGPTFGAATLSTTSAGSPVAGTEGVVKQGGTYRVYANVTDVGSAVGTVTADVSSISGSGATAVPMAAGSYTVGSTTYNYASAEQTASNPLTEGAQSYHFVATDTAANGTTSSSSGATVDNSGPSLSSIQMFDNNGNGKIDHVTATFNEALATSSDTSPWTLSHVPSGGSLSSVSTSGSTATLTLSEGSAAADTSVGSPAFTVALAQSSTGIRDALGNQGSFAGTTPQDKAAPIVVSLTRHSSSPTNASSLQFDATFSESVTGVDAADFTPAVSGLGGTPAVTGVSGSGSSYTVTVSTGSGDGTLGLNVTDNDSIADSAGNALGGTGSGNGSFTGQVYTLDRTAPSLTSLQMFDSDGNGTVDQVKATFNDTLANSTATAGWTLSSVPGGGTLSSVSTSGAVATLNLTGATANTAVGSFTVALSSGTGDIKDAVGNKASFAAQAPVDKAAPVVTALSLSNGGTTAGKIEPADTVVATYSEALHVSSLCSTWSGDTTSQSLNGSNDVTVTVNNNAGPAGVDTLTVSSASCTFHFGTINLGSANYASVSNLTFSGSGGSKSTIGWNPTSKTLTIGLGAKGGGTQGTVASSIAALAPDTAATDPASNALSGSSFSTANLQQF